MFYLIGFLIAALEEFITQGYLNHNLKGWIIPTFIAFLPFLFIVRTIGKHYEKKLDESRATKRYYLTAGTLGLMVEWFLIGLSPWGRGGGPLPLMLIFQFGMFSFWGGVALLPKILLDKKEGVVKIRRNTKRFLIFGFLLIYFMAFANAKVPKTQFLETIGAVMFTFIGLNYFYKKYFNALKQQGKA